jgi:drug/metabolite transporter (DMT)-like permease
MEKVSLPIKTKIAAWWLIIIGSGFVVISFFIRVMPEGYLVFPILFSIGFFFFLAGLLLFLKKRWAWGFAIIILIILTGVVIYFSTAGSNISSINSLFNPLIIIPLIPLILLLLDRKNFCRGIKNSDTSPL